MTALMLVLLSCTLAIHFIASKCWFLADYRSGWIMLLSNAVIESVERFARIGRTAQDVVLIVLISLGFAAVNPWSGMVAALVCSFIMIAAQCVEMRWRAEVSAQQYSLLPRVPLPIPKLCVVVRGPVLMRSKSEYSLGAWPEGLSQEYEVIITNPSTVRPQLPLHIEITGDYPNFTTKVLGDLEKTCPEPGEVAIVRFRIAALTPGPGGSVNLSVSHGDWTWRRLMKLEKVTKPGGEITKCEVTRWKYGTGGAFNWRGDHDLHDPSTFQSPEGLRTVLGMAARYRMPSSVMLSARLSLDQPAHEEFCKHHGWDRRSSEIPSFISFLQNEVNTALEQEFPTESGLPYSAEIGNHCYLHYGTHAAADPGNDWMSHAKMGDGRYDWMSSYPSDSRTEQRDNIIRGSQVLEKILGFKPASYTIPSDVYDEFTSRAVEDAGIEVGTDTDTNKMQKLLLFPKQHHPNGCAHLAELTRVLPKDPVNAAQIAMLKYWVQFARRSGRAMVFLAHHHLLLYQGNVCYNLTSELIRYVTSDTEGDVWCGTLTAIGRYWRDVLSLKTRKLQIHADVNRVIIQNVSSRELTGIPLEIEDSNGSRFLRIIDVPAAEQISV